jgi:hypothetical protein
MRPADLWSVLLLAVVSVGFLLAGAPLTKEAAVGAGFALAGAAITRLVDVVQERRREEAVAQERRRTDLDETRRVAYMALIAGETGWTVQSVSGYQLIATVANAFAHHGLQVPFEEAAAHLAQVVSGETDGDSGRWLREQIDQLTAKLEAENTRGL